MVGTVENGLTRVMFKRNIDSGDKDQDFIFDETNCAHFLFSWGGRVQNNGADFTKHSDRHASSQKFCFPNCAIPRRYQCCQGFCLDMLSVRQSHCKKSVDFTAE